MKLRIDDLRKEEFTSKDGRTFNKIIVTYNGEEYDCLAGKWNSYWNVGQTIDVPVEETKWGKKIKAPSYSGQGSAPRVNWGEKLAELEKRIQALESVQTAKKVFNSDSRDEPPTDWL